MFPTLGASEERRESTGLHGHQSGNEEGHSSTLGGRLAGSRMQFVLDLLHVSLPSSLDSGHVLLMTNGKRARVKPLLRSHLANSPQAKRESHGQVQYQCL